MNITRRTALLGGLTMPLLALAGKGISEARAAVRLPNPLIVDDKRVERRARSRQD